MSGKTAKAQRKDEKVEGTLGLPKLTEDESRDFSLAYEAQQQHHARWAEHESILLTKTADEISQQFNSKMTDGRLSTIAIEGAARVMAQLATGTVRALTKKNKGLAQLLSLFLTRYIQPYDNAQFRHLTKQRMVNLMARVYGVCATLYDIDVREDYLGPGSWILQIRNWYPQNGKLSIDDSDHNHVEVWRSVRWLKAQRGKAAWNDAVLQYVIRQVEKSGGEAPAQRDHNQQSVREIENDQNVQANKGMAGQVRMITRYENGKEGRWKTFFPDFDNIIGRDIQSRDGHIPIVLKHYIPLIDSIYGLGQFERGKTLQYASDSLVAMYFAGVQMSIFPPRIITKNGVVKSTLNYAPGATWVETVKDSIRNYAVSPEGLSTFQSSMGWLTGALLNQNGATDTAQTVEKTSDPSMGKTPQALKIQQARESAADAWDRAMQEEYLGTLYERMINLAPLTPKPFTFHIFDAEIKQIEESGLTDVMEVFDSGQEAKVTLAKSRIAGVMFKFTIDAGTTMQQDQAAEHEIYKELLTSLVQAPQLLAAAAADGKQIHVGEIIKQFIISGGAKDWEKIVTDISATGEQGAIQPGQPAQPGLPAQAGQQGMDPMQMAQLLSGQPAPEAKPQEAPDLTKDPDHQLIMALLDKMGPDALRKVMQSVGLPTGTMLPMEAEMIKNLSQPSKTDEQGIKEDIATIEVDPSSPYGAAVDPHAHLQGSKDASVRDLYQQFLSAGGGQPEPQAAPEPALAGVTS